MNEEEEIMLRVIAAYCRLLSLQQPDWLENEREKEREERKELEEWWDGLQPGTRLNAREMIDDTSKQVRKAFKAMPAILIDIRSANQSQ